MLPSYLRQLGRFGEAFRKDGCEAVIPAKGSRSVLNRFAIIAILLAAELLPARTPAQVRRATLSGTITNASGAGIASVPVSIKNSATGEARLVATNKDGLFTVPDLTPGTYDVSVSAPGFAPEVRTGIVLAAGADEVLNLRLRPGQTAAGAPGAPRESSTVGGVMSSTTVRELPLNARSGSDLAALQPGVATARTQTTGQANRGFGTQMTVSGARPRQNNYLLDGISLNDYANGPPGSALGVNLGVDAVEELSVLTSNYPAQYGRSSGGIIAVTTRSGLDEFHGDVYEFLRNSALDARNFFDANIPPFRRNQFGASAGGPIRKNRTSFFADYEGLRQSQGNTAVDSVPSAAARAGRLSTGQITVDPTVLRFVNAFYPLPNGPLLGSGDTGIYNFAGQKITPENYFTTRIDQKLTSRDSLYGTYMFDGATIRQPDELNDKRTGTDSRRQAVTLHESHAFSPQLINSVRVGISRVVATTGLTFPAANPLVADTSFGTVPGQTAASMLVPGLTQFSGGLGALGRYNFHWTSIQAYDDASLTKGNHSLRFGLALERIRDDILADSDPAGQFSFNSVADFLTNAPFSLSAAIPGTITERGFRQTAVGTYVQGDWRSKPNLTINLGVRYEMATVPTEVQAKLSTLRNITGSTPHLGAPLWFNSTLRNFEPRVGFSWDPFKNGKTSVSGGFGIFDVLPLPYLIQQNGTLSAPFFKHGSVTPLPPGSFPTAGFALIAASSNSFRQALFEPRPKRNYVMQWNLNVQRQLTDNVALMIGYVGSRGVHQPFRVEDVDIVMPALTPQGYLWPLPVGSGKRLNPNAGLINGLFWASNSFYDGLEVQVKERSSKGLEFEGSYTWGRTIDTSSGSLVGDEYSNSIASPLWFNPQLNRGLADFHLAQDLELSYTWEIPAPKRVTGFPAWALEGWQLGGIYAASTGAPFTPDVGGDALGLNSTDTSLDLPNLVVGPGCRSLVNPGNPNHYIKTQCFAVPNPITLRGNLGRNSLIGPGLSSLDFSLIKNNHIKRISDAFNVQFRAEFFNILNRANFSPPLDNKDIFDSSGNPIGSAGLITGTETPSRQILFAVKVIW